MRQGALTLSIVATDPDFDTLTYSALGLPAGMTINSTTGVISGTVPVGVHTITARASDGASTVSVVFVITATVNTAPTLVQPANQNNDTNDVVSLQLVAADVDLDPLTFSSTGLPAGLTLNPSTGRITGTPASGTGGANPVTVTVSDGSLSASRSFTWNVTDLNPGSGGRVWIRRNERNEHRRLDGEWPFRNDFRRHADSVRQIRQGTVVRRCQ